MHTSLYRKLPTFVNPSCWPSCVISVFTQRINYYDSMGGGGKTVTNSLLLWLEDEDEDKNKDEATFDPDEWTTVGTKVSTTPQQVRICYILGRLFLWDCLSLKSAGQITWMLYLVFLFCSWGVF